jgi:glycosyltransferase involved in cell wall biosynthesis
MGKTYHLKNVIYFPSFHIVGGVETYCYEMALKYGKDYDLTIVYQSGDPQQMQRLREITRVVKFREGDKIVCDVFIFGWGWDILDSVEAKEYIQTYHADFKARGISPCLDSRVTKRFGVADNTTVSIREHFPVEVETMYNPYTVKKPRKVLKLISATRLSEDKGLSRMLKLADALDEADIPYLWTIYTDREKDTKHPNMVCLKPRLDVLDFIADADYLVQLSDSEGYSYSIVEALSVGTPVICTDFGVAHEQGVENGKTGFILPFDMSNIPVQAIYKGVKKFQYTPRESHYETVFSKGKPKYKYSDTDIVTVRVLTNFFDIERNAMSLQGSEYEVTRKRAKHLEELKLVEALE